MSADNWSICPKCKQAGHVVTQEEAIEKVMAKYGKMPYPEFEKTLSAAKKHYPESTMREDYELGVNWDGKFAVDYRASCSKCGFAFGYKIEDVDVFAKKGSSCNQ